MRWPATSDALVAHQHTLATADPPPWQAPAVPAVGGCFDCPPRGVTGTGAAGDPLWAGAAVYRDRRCVARATAAGTAGAPYLPGLLALRAGPVLAAAVRALDPLPDVLLVDGTGRDHPRRAGMATDLGAALGVPTVGVTHRPLLAAGDWPDEVTGATSPLWLDGDVVAVWLRTRAGRRPVAVHPGWRTDPATAAWVVGLVARHRTPAPLREARRLARQRRATASGTAGRRAAG